MLFSRACFPVVFALILTFVPSQSLLAADAEVTARYRSVPETITSDQLLSVQMRVTNDDPSNPAFTTYGLVNLPSELVHISGTSCGELEGNNQTICNFGRVTTRKTRTINFALSDPGDCPKTVTLPPWVITSTNMIYNRAILSNSTTVQVECPAGESDFPPVDLTARFSVQPPETVNGYEAFPIRVQARNLHEDLNDIFNVRGRITVPPEFVYVPHLADNDDFCTFHTSTRVLECNYFTLRPAKHKTVFFALRPDATCEELAGNAAFGFEVESNTTVSSQLRTEVNPGNESVNSRNINITCEGRPDVAFEMVHPTDVSRDSLGRLEGVITYRAEVFNPSASNTLDNSALQVDINESSSPYFNRLRFNSEGSSSDCGQRGFSQATFQCDYGNVVPGARKVRFMQFEIINPPLISQLPPSTLCTFQNRVVNQFPESDRALINSLTGLELLPGGYFATIDPDSVTENAGRLIDLDCSL